MVKAYSENIIFIVEYNNNYAICRRKGDDFSDKYTRRKKAETFKEFEQTEGNA